MNYQQFFEAHNMGLTYTKTDENPHMPNFPADHYVVGLTLPGDRLFTCYFSKGLGHEGAPPTPEEVLYAVSMDAGLLDCSPNFEEWAANLGYDPDSRQALKTYEQCCEQTERLKDFLGETLLAELIACEED